MVEREEEKLRRKGRKGDEIPETAIKEFRHCLIQLPISHLYPVSFTGPERTKLLRCTATKAETGTPWQDIGPLGPEGSSGPLVRDAGLDWVALAPGRPNPPGRDQRSITAT